MTRRIFVAKVGEIPVSKTKSFRFGILNGIAYNDDGVIKAYVNFCTHAGGRLSLAPQGVFRCANHFAEFDPKTGLRLSGEAPEGSRLKDIPLTIEGDSMWAELHLHDE